MPKSIRTTSNPLTPTNSTPATFKAGDSVLWAAVSNDTYKLQSSSDKRGNRQAIATLYHGASATQSSQPNKEVSLLSSAQLSNMAFDIEHAAEALDDIGQTLALIYYDKVEKSTAKSLALTGSKEVANHG